MLSKIVHNRNYCLFWSLSVLYLLIRSSYFQKIEEDVEKYTQQITQLGPSIANFKNKDMEELINFHRDVESVLENLTDETQVSSEKSCMLKFISLPCDIVFWFYHDLGKQQISIGVITV